MKMTPTAYERGIADGSFTVQRDVLGRIVAQIPPGSDVLLETPSQLEERVRVKAPDWMVGYATPCPTRSSWSRWTMTPALSATPALALVVSSRSA